MNVKRGRLLFAVMYFLFAFRNSSSNAQGVIFAPLVAGFSVCQSTPGAFFELAKEMSSETFTDPKLKKPKVETLESIQKEIHELLINLEKIKTNDNAIKRVLESSISGLDELFKSLDALSKLPEPSSEFESIIGAVLLGALAGDALEGALAGGKLGFNNGIKREEYGEALKKVGLSLTKLENVCSLMPSLAKKFGAKFEDNAGRFACNIDETYPGMAPEDWIYIYNSGKSLDNVSIDLAIKGLGKSGNNYCFLSTWPSESWICIPCEGTETVPRIESAKISIISEDYSTNFNAEYSQKERDADIARYLADLKIECSYQAFESGIIWDTQRGVSLKLTGYPILQKPKVTVTFSAPGVVTKSLFWEIDSLTANNSKVFDSKAFSFNPKVINILIELPGTTYKIEKAINFK